MNKKWLILASVLVVLLLIGFGFWSRRPVPAWMGLELTGTPGLKVAGTLVVDGVPREFSGAVPTGITLEARTFEYTIWMQEPRGELHGELTVTNGPSGSSSTTNDFSGVRGHYEHSWRGKGLMMTTARKGE